MRRAILAGGAAGSAALREEDGLNIRTISAAGCAAAMAALLLSAQPALAEVPRGELPVVETAAARLQDAATQEAAPAVLERSLYKTLVFEGATNAIDLALFGSLLGGHLYAGPAFVAVNATAAALIYYGHEVVWGYLGPAEEDYETRDNLLKGLTFRLASSTRAFAVGYGFTGDPIAAGGFMAASAVGETVVYVANEYGWAWYDRARRPAAGPASPAIPTMIAAGH